MTKIHEAKSATVKDDVLGKESSLKGTPQRTDRKSVV